MGVGVATSTALTPQNRNYAGLKRYVANYVQGAASPSILGLAGDAILSGIDILNEKTWNWSVKTQDITTAASDADYSLNSDFKKARKLLVLDSSSNRTGYLHYKDPKVFLDEHPYATSNSTPGVYTIINPVNNPVVLLDYAPTSDWVSSYPTLRLYYFARIQHFSSDSDTMNDIGAAPEAWSFLGWYGRWDLASVRGAPGSVIDRAFAMWNRILRDMKADDGDTMTDWEV